MNNPQRYMLDTNAASALIRGQIDATAQQTLLHRNLCISVITEAELCFGITRKPNATRLAQCNCTCNFLTTSAAKAAVSACLLL